MLSSYLVGHYKMYNKQSDFSGWSFWPINSGQKIIHCVNSWYNTFNYIYTYEWVYSRIYSLVCLKRGNLTNKQIHRVCGYNWPTGIGVPYLKRQSICCGSVAQDSVVILVSMVDNVGIVRTIWDVYGCIMFILFWGVYLPSSTSIGIVVGNIIFEKLGYWAIEPTRIWMWHGFAQHAISSRMVTTVPSNLEVDWHMFVILLPPQVLGYPQRTRGPQEKTACSFNPLDFRVSDCQTLFPDLASQPDPIFLMDWKRKVHPTQHVYVWFGNISFNLVLKR